MKSTKILIALAAVLSLLSCNKLKENIKISVPATMEYDFVIPVIEEAGNLSLDEGVVALDIEELIKKENSKLSTSNIQSVIIKSLDIEVHDSTQYDEDNLTILSSFEAKLSSDTDPNPKVIAKDDNSPTNAFQYTVPVNTDVNYANYFYGKEFKYKINAITKRTTTQEIKCTAIIKFTVTAGL